MTTEAPQAFAQKKRVCVDASLVLHLLLPNERDRDVEAQWRAWATAGVETLGPSLLYAEVTSVIRLRVATGRLTADEGEEVFAAFNALDGQEGRTKRWGR